MTFARGLVVVLALVSGCGAASSSPPPSKGPDVVIPEVTDDQSKRDEEEPAPPSGVRENPVVPEEAVGVEPGSPDDMWGSFGSGPAQSRGGLDCDRAADCCLKFYQKSAGDPSVHRICASMRIAPSSLCAQLLSSFQSTAPSIGVQCP